MAITTLNLRALNRSDTASSGQVVTATSATAMDFQAAVGGKIGQVLQSVGDTVQTRSGDTNFFDLTDLSIAITPAATSSKILVLADVKYSQDSSSRFLRLLRDSTAIYYNDTLGSRVAVFSHDYDGNASNDYAQLKEVTAMYLDSPSTTSAVTYKIQGASEGASNTFYLNRTKADRNAAINPERVASSITVMEVLA